MNFRTTAIAERYLREGKIRTIWMATKKEVKVLRALDVYVGIEQSLRGIGLGRELISATRSKRVQANLFLESGQL